MKHFSKSLVCLLLVALLAAAVLTGCAQNNTSTEAPKTEAQTAAPSTAAQTEAPKTEAQTEAPKTEAQTAAPTTAAHEGPQELGEGEKTFYFEVTSADGETSSYTIHTNQETVGGALVDLQLIDGDPGDYGLYVKTVCGETLDWDSQNMYWAFYENGEYAMTGVDTTAITEGATYGFVATKG